MLGEYCIEDVNVCMEFLLLEGRRSKSPSFMEVFQYGFPSSFA
jgi:hypothetical protein